MLELVAGEPVFRRELGIGGSKINTEIFRMRASRNGFQFDLRKEIPCNDSRKMVVHCMQGVFSPIALMDEGPDTGSGCLKIT